MQYPHKTLTPDVARAFRPSFVPGCESGFEHGGSVGRGAGGFSEVARGQRVRPKAEGGSPLGSKRQSFHPKENDKREKLNKIRREERADQLQAAAIYRANYERAAERSATLEEVNAMPGRGVCFCGWTQIAEKETALRRVQKPHGWHAYIEGTQKCGLRWVCPVCTKVRAEADRKDVNDGLAAAREMDGVWPVMLTLTTRHRARESAKSVLKGIMVAEQRVKRLKVWGRISDQMLGYARVLEWTYGESGHHPHYHMIMLMRAASEADAIEAVKKLQPAYMDQMRKAGRDGVSPAAWQRSFQVQGAAAAAKYVTKWGIAEEITGGQVKDSMTPWRLLRLSRTASDDCERRRAAALWWEIMLATKGKAQLFKSEGWNELVEAWRSRQPEPELEPEPELVRSLGIREKGSDPSIIWMIARTKTLALREAAESELDLAAAQVAVEAALRQGQTDEDLTAADPDDFDLIDEGDDGLEAPVPSQCLQVAFSKIVDNGPKVIARGPS